MSRLAKRAPSTRVRPPQVTFQAGPDLQQALASWRDAHAPGASLAAVMRALLRSAMGLPPEPAPGPVVVPAPPNR